MSGRKLEQLVPPKQPTQWLDSGKASLTSLLYMLWTNWVEETKLRLPRLSCPGGDSVSHMIQAFLLIGANYKFNVSLSFPATSVPKPVTPAGPLNINAYSADSITLSWQPHSKLEHISSYRVEKRESNRQKWDVVGLADARDTTYTVRNLKPGTDYYFRVVAENLSGTPSAPLTLERPFIPRAPVGEWNFLTIALYSSMPSNWSQYLLILLLQSHQVLQEALWKSRKLPETAPPSCGIHLPLMEEPHWLLTSLRSSKLVSHGNVWHVSSPTWPHT